MKHLKTFESIDYGSEMSEGLEYHLNNKIPLTESIYRIESEAWLDLINECRFLWESGLIDLNEDDLFILSTDAGTKVFFEGKEVLLDVPFALNEEDYLKEIPFESEELEEAILKGKKVNLNKPFRTPAGPRKFSVYTKNDKGNVVKVSFGQPGMRVNNNDPDKSRSFRKRMRCDSPGPKWKPRYWACNVGRYSKLLGLKSSRPW